MAVYRNTLSFLKLNMITYINGVLESFYFLHLNEKKKNLLAVDYIYIMNILNGKIYKKKKINSKGLLRLKMIYVSNEPLKEIHLLFN